MVAAAWAVARAVEVTVKWVLWNAKKSAWKALRGVGRLRRPLRRPHSARRGPRERPVAARGEPGVFAQWPARCLGQKSRSRPLGSAPERVRLGGEARGGERRESD